MIKLYKSFKLEVTKRIADGTGFVAITEMKLMNVGTAGGEQLLTGGVATASSIYGAGYEASTAFDANLSTRWATSGGALPAWIRYDMPVAIEKPKFIYLLLNSTPSNGPSDFTLQGSNDDGVTWDILFSAVGFATEAQLKEGVVRSTARFGVSGYALNSQGLPAKRVMVYDWPQGDLLKKLTPSASGLWSFAESTSSGTQYLVVAIGEDGDRPQAHGPVVGQELM